MADEPFDVPAEIGERMDAARHTVVCAVLGGLEHIDDTGRRVAYATDIMKEYDDAFIEYFKASFMAAVEAQRGE